MKALPAFLVLLLALAPIAGGTVGAPIQSPAGVVGNSADATMAQVAASPDPAPRGQMAENRTVRVLDISDDTLTRSSIERQRFDLGPALDASSNASAERIRTAAVIERIESAESNDHRQRLILGALNDIEQRTVTIRSVQRQTVAAYGDGKIDSKRLLVRLAELSDEARALEERRERIDALAEETDGFTLDDGRLAELERTLVTFTGPVRDHALAVIRGEAPPTRFYVATEDNGVVLATIVDGEYLRESFRGTHRGQGAADISPEDALNVTAESYPNVWRTSQNSTDVVGSGSSYLVRISHQSGYLGTFVDSDRMEVFKEFQRRPLGEMEHGDPVSDVKDGLRLQVNQTYPGGPLHVRLTDADTGTPVAANVTVGLEGSNSDFVGTTGPDGSLWTLTPRGQFTVTAIDGNSVVFVTLDPADIPSLNASVENTNNTTSTV